jgi:hypothetical protein
MGIFIRRYNIYTHTYYGATYGTGPSYSTRTYTCTYVPRKASTHTHTAGARAHLSASHSHARVRSTRRKQIYMWWGRRTHCTSTTRLDSISRRGGGASSRRRPPRRPCGPASSRGARGRRSRRSPRPPPPRSPPRSCAGARAPGPSSPRASRTANHIMCVRYIHIHIYI